MHGRERRDAEDVRDRVLGRPDVEDAARAGVRVRDRCVVGRICRALIRERRKIARGGPVLSDLPVEEVGGNLEVVRAERIERGRVAAVLRRELRHRRQLGTLVVRAAAEQLPRGERAGVRLQLQVSPVLVPVADLERERGEQEQAGQHQPEHEQDAALFATSAPEQRGQFDHGHVPDGVNAVACRSIRIVALVLIGMLARVKEPPTNGRIVTR